MAGDFRVMEKSLCQCYSKLFCGGLLACLAREAIESILVDTIGEEVPS